MLMSGRLVEAWGWVGQADPPHGRATAGGWVGPHRQGAGGWVGPQSRGADGWAGSQGHGADGGVGPHGRVTGEWVGTQHGQGAVG